MTRTKGEQVPDNNGEARGIVASERIADLVRERILSGRLQPGARIIQDELAEELRTSRLPVREALRILASRGLVTVRANQGARVIQMDLRECQLSYRIRERIEPLLLAESAPRLTDEDLAELVELQERIEAAGDDVESFLVLDRQLHWATYRRHQADELASMVARLWDTTQHYRRAYTRLAGAQHSWVIRAEHRLLIEALQARDLSSAERVLELHIRRTRAELARHPEVFAPAP
jgi:DNA-binding GntR family transcriptional regulator